MLGEKISWPKSLNSNILGVVFLTDKILYQGFCKQAWTLAYFHWLLCLLHKFNVQIYSSVFVFKDLLCSPKNVDKHIWSFFLGLGKKIIPDWKYQEIQDQRKNLKSFLSSRKNCYVGPELTTFAIRYFLLSYIVFSKQASFEYFHIL